MFLLSVLYCKKPWRRKILPHNTLLLHNLIKIWSRDKMSHTSSISHHSDDKWRRQYSVTVTWFPRGSVTSEPLTTSSRGGEHWTKRSCHTSCHSSGCSLASGRGVWTIQWKNILFSYYHNWQRDIKTQDMTIECLAQVPSPQLHTFKYLNKYTLF